MGDTYPNQHLEVVVRCYLYRWKVERKPGDSGMPNVRCFAVQLVMRLSSVAFGSPVGLSFMEALLCM